MAINRSSQFNRGPDLISVNNTTPTLAVLALVLNLNFGLVGERFSAYATDPPA